MRQLTHILVIGLAFQFFGCGDPQLRNPKQSSVQAEPCGTVIGSLDGIYAFSNGSANETGVSCAGEDGIYGWEYQCKELVSRYFTKKFGSPLVFCDAGQCLDAFSRYPNDFQTFNNGTQIPKHGDAIVFAGRPGHIAVIDKVADGKVTFLQQNTLNAWGSVSLKGKILGNWSENNFSSLPALGFIRSNKNTAPATGNTDSNTKKDTSSTSKTCANRIVANLGGDSHVNLRSEASTQSSKVGRLASHDAHKVDRLRDGGSAGLITDSTLGRSSSKWYHVISPQEGWISELYSECAK